MTVTSSALIVPFLRVHRVKRHDQIEKRGRNSFQETSDKNRLACRVGYYRFLLIDRYLATCYLLGVGLSLIRIFPRTVKVIVHINQSIFTSKVFSIF